MIKFPKYYIGPMSKNVVDCVIKHSQKNLIGLIPSRRQVDYCGGYVNNWNTKQFSEPAFLCAMCRAPRDQPA